MTDASLPWGVDVSSYQGRIDWASVAGSGCAFSICKATEGVGYVDPTFGPNWAGMQHAGLIRGAYTFARPDNDAPEAEAEFFCNHVEAAGLEAGDILALDLEDGSGDLSDWVARFLATVQRRVGFSAIVYSSPAFIVEHGLANRPEIGTVGLWLASWGVSVPAPVAPWSLVAFHQYADNGSVPGIAGAVDMDRFNGAVESIRLYGKPADPAPGPTPAPAYVVGSGILDRMTALGDVPASDERFPNALWSEALGRSGIRYVYWRGTGEITMYPPAA